MNKIRIVLIPAHYDNIFDIDGWLNTGSNLSTQLESREFTQEEDLKNYIKNFISAIKIYNLNEIMILTLAELSENIFLGKIDLHKYFLSYCSVDTNN
jgi:hypothetical protein